MANAPTVNTNSWRLPKKAHSAPEATFTDEMYRRKGLPVAPDPTPTTGGSGLPTVSTEDWRLPKKGEKPLEETFDPAGLGLADIQGTEFRGFPKGGQERAILLGSDRKFKAHMRKLTGKRDPSYEDIVKALVKQGLPDKRARQYAMWAADKFGGTPSQKHATRRAAYYHHEDEEPVDESGCGGGGRKSLLKKTSKRRQPVGPPRAADDDAANESLTDRMRRLAGLVESGDRPFAMGTPHRHMPNPEVPSVIAEAVERPSPLMEAEGKLIGKGQARKGMKIGTWKVAKVSPTRVTILSASGVDVGPKFAGKRYTYTWDGTGYKRQGQYLHTDGIRALKESQVSREQRSLAGMTERSAMPHPMHDTRPVRKAQAHGILDDGADAGESYVEQVLAESRWFFGGEGPQRPFDEAPGGRAGPWRGSDDEPAPTPIVRKGKVHGEIGKHKTPEEGGEVDVGKSEIDYDKTPGDDEEEKKAKAKSREKAPPEDDEEEPEPEDDTEEPEDEPEDPDQDEAEDEDDEDEARKKAEWIGEEGSRAGNVARKTGGLIKRVGGAIHHGGSKMQHATSWLKSEPAGGGKGKKGKKKPKGGAPKAKKTPARKPSPVKAKAKPKTKPKPLRPKPKVSPHKAALKRSAARKAKLTKSGKAPKLKKMKRRLRERLALLVAASASLL